MIAPLGCINQGLGPLSPSNPSIRRPGSSGASRRPLSCHESGFKILNINLSENAKNHKNRENLRKKSIYEMEPKPEMKAKTVPEVIEDDVFTVNDIPTEKKENIKVRRRRSMPTMRRSGTENSYQTLPNPKKYSKSKSDATIIATNQNRDSNQSPDSSTNQSPAKNSNFNFLSSTLGRPSRSNSNADNYRSLSRKPSIKKAKV